MTVTRPKTKLAIKINSATALMLGIQRFTGSEAGSSTPRPAAPSAAPSSNPIAPQTS